MSPNSVLFIISIAIAGSIASAEPKPGGDQKEKPALVRRQCPSPWEKNLQQLNAHIYIQCKEGAAKDTSQKFGEASLNNIGSGYFCLIAKKTVSSANDLQQLKRDLLACVAHAKTLCTATKTESAYGKMFGAFCGSTTSSYYWTDLEDLPPGITAESGALAQPPAEAGGPGDGWR